MSLADRRAAVRKTIASRPRSPYPPPTPPSGGPEDIDELIAWRRLNNLPATHRETTA